MAGSFTCYARLLGVSGECRRIPMIRIGRIRPGARGRSTIDRGFGRVEICGGFAWFVWLIWFIWFHL